VQAADQGRKGLKLAVAGKGGVGKTTLVALLAREAHARGWRVLAVDADPDANLATTLGYRGPIRPLAEEEELIRERAGSQGFVALNPRVDDIPERHWVEVGGIRLLVLGGIRRGGGGCACPANALLRALLRHLVLDRDELVVVDMEAGIEHLGRATAQGVDALLVVVEPDLRSLETAARILPLAREIGLGRVWAVGNKVEGAEDEEFLRENLPPGLDLLGSVPYLPELRRLEKVGSPPVPPQIKALFSRLLQALGPHTAPKPPTPS